MKIGVYTGRLSRWGEKRYQMLRSLGYSCVDFNMANTNISPYDLDEIQFAETLLQERQLAEQAGIEINQVHGPWRWPPEDFAPENRMERMEKMQRSIRAASLLGAKNWVVHPLMPFGIEDIDSGNEQDTWDINVEFMQRLLITAKEYDVTICLENMPMPKFSIGSVSDVLRFVKTMNDSHFKICLDTGHVAVFPGESPSNALRELGSEVRALHIHDNDGKSDLHKIPYDGIIDWEDFAQALQEVGYQGVFSYETAPSGAVSLEDAESIYLQMIETANCILAFHRT